MSRAAKALFIPYILLLAATLGATVYAGAVVAPVTFHTADWLGEPLLSRFQEGLIMTENFARLAVLVSTAGLAMLLFEGSRLLRGERDWISAASALLAIACGAAFSFHFVPGIESLQAQGAAVTQSPAFESLHRASEGTVKVYTLALLVLLVRRLQLALR